MCADSTTPAMAARRPVALLCLMALPLLAAAAPQPKMPFLVHDAAPASLHARLQDFQASCAAWPRHAAQLLPPDPTKPFPRLERDGNLTRLRSLAANPALLDSSVDVPIKAGLWVLLFAAVGAITALWTAMSLLRALWDAGPRLIAIRTRI